METLTIDITLTSQEIIEKVKGFDFGISHLDFTYEPGEALYKVFGEDFLSDQEIAFNADVLIEDCKSVWFNIHTVWVGEEEACYSVDEIKAIERAIENNIQNTL